MANTEKAEQPAAAIAQGVPPGTPPESGTDNPALEAARASGRAQEASARLNAVSVVSTSNRAPAKADLAEAAKQRDESSAQARDAEVRRIAALTGEKEPDVLWVLSNRVDDRVVLFERDDRHPGGEAFVGGSAPDHVYRTPEVAAALNDGTLIEVPEPRDGPKKPIALSASGLLSTPSTPPGAAVRLGRTPDADLFDVSAVRAIQTAQKAKPAEQPVPRGVVVPSAPAAERETARR